MPPTHNPTMPRIGHVQATMRHAPSFAERRAALIEAWQRAQALPTDARNAREAELEREARRLGVGNLWSAATPHAATPPAPSPWLDPKTPHEHAAVGGLYKCQRCAVLRAAAGVPHREGSR